MNSYLKNVSSFHVILLPVQASIPGVIASLSRDIISFASFVGRTPVSVPHAGLYPVSSARLSYINLLALFFSS